MGISKLAAALTACWLLAPAFTLKAQDGRDVSLDALLKKGLLAMVFYRSADW